MQSSECQEARRERRRAKRLFRKERTTTNRKLYHAACSNAKMIYTTQRKAYYVNKLQSCQSDSRNTYHIINQLLDKQFSDTDYSSSSTHDYELACKFADYFDNKIRKISANILANYSELSAGNGIEKYFNNFNFVFQTSMVHNVEKLNMFEVLSFAYHKSVITSLQSKTCDLDSLPTPILKSCLDVLLLPIQHIVNLHCIVVSFQLSLSMQALFHC